MAAAQPSANNRARRSRQIATWLVALLLIWTLGYGCEHFEFNARNKATAKQVMVALITYHKQNGRYPPTIDALTPGFLLRPLPLVPGTSLYYAVSPAGDRFWLALVPWKGTVVPIDRALEFDSAQGFNDGVVRDVSELTAKDVGIRRHLPKQ